MDLLFSHKLFVILPTKDRKWHYDYKRRDNITREWRGNRNSR